VGAGPAGLAAGYGLTRGGFRTTILEQGPAPGAAWQDLYDSLRLHTGKHLSALPGLGFARGTPLFPSKREFIGYLHAYADRHRLPIRFGCRVEEARWAGGRWRLETTQGALESTRLVLATGILSNPFTPRWPGLDGFRGTVMHSVGYKNPSRWIGRRVLVVGTGNSAAEIATELGRVGVTTGIAVRTGAHVVPLRLFGLPIQYWSHVIERLPRPVRELLARATAAAGVVRGRPVIPRPPWSPLDRPPIIGFGLPDAVRSGLVTLHPDLHAFGDQSVTFADGREEPYDTVILATGFRAAVGFLREKSRTDARGFPAAEGVRCSDLPRCCVIGHHYAAVGALANIGRDATLLARAAAAL
jgi:cation diffusion facilitator CzcD-associated flavoprotein CzcO